MHISFTCFTAGQKIAIRIKNQVRRRSEALKKLLKLYNSLSTSEDNCVTFEEASNPASQVWNRISDSLQETLNDSVPSYIRRQAIDLVYLEQRAKEEKDIVQMEMSNVISYFSGKLDKIAVLKEQLDSSSRYHRGLLSMLLVQEEETAETLHDLTALFGRYIDVNALTSIPPVSMEPSASQNIEEVKITVVSEEEEDIILNEILDELIEEPEMVYFEPCSDDEDADGL